MQKMLSKDMHSGKNVDGPQILIYHTHSQEGYAGFSTGEFRYHGCRVGEHSTTTSYAKICGMNVPHHTGNL